MSKIKKLFSYNQTIINRYNSFLAKPNIISKIIVFLCNSLFYSYKLIKKIFLFFKRRIKRVLKHVYLSNYFYFNKFNVEPNPIVSIIIPFYNQIDMTINCLISIKKSGTLVPYEIICANDNSNDKKLRRLKRIKGIKIISNSKNLGYIKNCNNSAKYAKGKYLYFLNNDTIVGYKWLDELLSVFQNNERVGVVGSKILNLDGTLQEFGGQYYKNFSYLFSVSSNIAQNDSKCCYLKECDYVSGCSLMTQREIFIKNNGFSEEFTNAYFDDCDYCLSLKYNFGLKTYVQPYSVVKHYGNSSYKINNLINELKNINKKTFLEKWNKFLNKNKISYKNKMFFSNEKIRKPSVIFVDDFLPQFDRHAGGLVTYQYLNILINLGFDIKFCPFNGNANQEPYKHILSNLGIEIISPETTFDYLYNYSNLIDYLFISRPTIANHFLINKIKFLGVKVYYLGQDLHYLRMQREYERGVKNNTIDEIELMKEIETTIVNLCDCSFYGSIEEINILNKLCNKSPIYLPLFNYDIENRPNHKNFETSKNIIFVGSGGHYANKIGLEWFFDKVWNIIIKNINIKLIIVGSFDKKFIKRYKNKYVQFTGNISKSELEHMLLASRVSIAPLTYGAGVKGKIIESIYYGTPVVTTNIGAEGIFDAKNVLLISDDANEFANHIIRLYNNENEWNNMCIKFKEFLNRYYSLANAKSIFKNYFNNTMRRNK